MEPSKELEKVIESKFLTPQKFAIEIEKIVAEENLNYIDAIVHYCDMNSLEIESITKLISKEQKCDYERALQYLKMLKKEKRYLLDVY